MSIKTYRDLKVWQHSMDLVTDIYQLTKSLPDHEKYGLISQIRRAAISIPANIAEGYGRKHRKEYLHHLSFANGSLKEVETFLILCTRLNYLDRNDLKEVWDLAQQIGKILNQMSKKLSE